MCPKARRPHTTKTAIKAGLAVIRLKAARRRVSVPDVDRADCLRLRGTGTPINGVVVLRLATDVILTIVHKFRSNGVEAARGFSWQLGSVTFFGFYPYFRPTLYP
jgi:hypothetical protein